LQSGNATRAATVGGTSSAPAGGSSLDSGGWLGDIESDIAGSRDARALLFGWSLGRYPAARASLRATGPQSAFRPSAATGNHRSEVIAGRPRGNYRSRITRNQGN